jgi:hypothetical protein
VPGGQPPASLGASPSSSEDPVALICQAFDIVTSDIHDAYDVISQDPSAMPLQGLAIMAAGADIADLADQTGDAEVARHLRELGEAYVVEGSAVNEANMGDSSGQTIYLALLDQYGQDCPL